MLLIIYVVVIIFNYLWGFLFSCFVQSQVLNDFVLTVTQIWYSFELVFCVRVCVVCFFVVILFCFVFSFVFVLCMVCCL